MKLTGIADEAGDALTQQIKAHQQLGWDTIEARFVQVGEHGKGSIHEIPEDAFGLVEKELREAEMGVCGVGSTIGNWAHSILDPFEITEGEVTRCIERMQRLNCGVVRIMTYAILEDGKEDDLPEQHRDERFKRTRDIKNRFDDAEITVVHENCMNYGGMSVEHAKETMEALPGMKWVFDTGNPVFNPDRSKSRPYPRQDAWEFYEVVKEHIAHVHIKDGVWNDEKKEMTFTLPGEGDGDVERILRDLKDSGYDGYISIEPHTAAVFHDTESITDPEEKQREMFESYIVYGERMKELMAAL
ncbi:MAG: TIM barrel protein [Verrucomicrobiota bacterium]